MPAPVPIDPRSKRLLTALFWGGVALAPVAALILLVADGNGPLRFAAVLAIMAVVLIGLSIALRTEGDAGDAEELRAELDELRRELRGEIVAAAQRGNQALDEAQRVQEALAGLRRRVDAVGAGPVAGAEAPGVSRARVVPPEPETPARYAERPTGQAGVYGAAQAAAHGVGPADDYEDEQPGSAYAADRPAADRPVSGSAGVYGAASRPEYDNRSGDPVARPLGMVRHTETVHVTTRHTIVDGGVGESGARYGGYAAPWSGPEERARGGHGAERDDRPRPEAEERFRRDEARSWSGGAREEERSRPDAANERSWSGPREDWATPRDEHSGYRDDRPGHRAEPAGHRAEPSGHRADRDWAAPRDESGWDGGGQQWDVPVEPAPSGRRQRPDDTGEYWSQLRAGDRWAAVRDDDRGRELRMGERRAEVHADNAGTEYRVADRWASVRRDEPRRDDARRDEVRQDEPRRGADGDEGWREGWGEPENRPALPAGGVPVPQQWRPPRQPGYQSEPARGYQPEPAYGHQPEPARGYQPEPAYGYQPEPARGYQPEPLAGGYPPEPGRGPRPGHEPYDRRQPAEEPGYGHPVHERAPNRWR
ncbi:hypothetical protein QQG74_29745 [Micromonospora sp. FIMYZ51]|uniref:hypothetical protein n=1 Tax=Micromonospora sp. FIMYZ51 TaxID=3051832 RepID=UPI00311F08DE